MTEFKYILPKFYKPENNSIAVSEAFFSCQGEGSTQGVSAIFLRTQGCNLFCHWNNKNLKLEPCDTITQWKEGKYWLITELIQDWINKGWLDKLKTGSHLVCTGGEVLLRQQEYIELFQQLRTIQIQPYIEIESNATIKPNSIFDSFVQQYNLSPKLQSSNMPTNTRYRENVLQHFARDKRAIFKFVITSVKDMEEIQNDFVNKFSIPNNRIWLMPLADTRDELITNSEYVVELAKKYGYNYSSRLQIELWNKTVGV